MRVSTWLALWLILTVIRTEIPECNFNYLPMPHTCNIHEPGESRHFDDVCSIVYRVNVKEENGKHIQELITHYQNKTFHCRHAYIVYQGSLENLPEMKNPYTVQINIQDASLKSAFTLEEESYKLAVDTKKATITAGTYVGFVRGIETFSQTVQCNQTRGQLTCRLENLPINIEDSPEFVYRGVMIDTSRHFLPLYLILETVDAMMYNKMNVMHWHITDQDSFPLILDSHPEIAQYGAFSEFETYTSDDARQVVRYAMVRGVRVIPELDTPGHAASWGKAPDNKEIACTFGGGYMGPLDVTMDKTYQVLRDVMAEINDIFPDPIFHFGGDEVSLTCLKNATEAKKDMQQYNVGGNFELYFRKRQHKIMMGINPSKTPMYWMNSGQMSIESQDVIHWWGGGFPDTTNKVVISNYGPYYLDMGVGNYYGVGYGSYINWLDFYNRNLKNEIQGYRNKDNVLGAEACLWSEISNQFTHHLKIWMRTSSLAERLWNSKIRVIKPGVLRRLAKQERLMNRKGIATAPVTCQQCQANAQLC